MQKKEKAAGILIGMAVGLGLAYALFAPSGPETRYKRERHAPREEQKVILADEEQMEELKQAPTRSVAKRLIDYLLQAEDPWPMRDPSIKKEPKQEEVIPQPDELPQEGVEAPVEKKPTGLPKTVLPTKQPKTRAPKPQIEPDLPRREPVFRNEILVPEIATKIESKAPRVIKQKPLPKQRIENLPYEVITPRVRDSRFQHLYAQQSKYMAMRWRKFISRRNHFTVWVPGQLYYHLYSDDEKTELYHCEFRQVIYGVQRQEIETYERPVGRGNQLAFFRAAAALWIDQYMEESPGVRVLYQQVHQTPYLAQDVMVLGPHGQTKMRIGLRGHGLFWIWTAYRNDRIGEERFSDFLASIDVLK